MSFLPYHKGLFNNIACFLSNTGHYFYRFNTLSPPLSCFNNFNASIFYFAKFAVFFLKFVV